MVKVTPRRIRLEASSFCQLRCPSCPTTSGAIHPAVGSGFLRFKDFQKLIDDSPGLERIELSNYGEIFLNPELPRILEYAHSKAIPIWLENGANLNHVRDEVLEALVKYQVRAMTCSIDGASPETYRTYRVKGDFNVVIRNIEKINAYKRQYQSEWPRLLWQFVVFGHNEHEIPAARDRASRLGMAFTLNLTWDSRFSPIRDKAFVQAQLGDTWTDRGEFEAACGEKYASGICHQLWDDPQINWDGKVLGCCRNFWGDFGGNAFTDGLTESINHEKMSYARDMLLGLKPPREDIPCTTCEMYEAMQKRSRFVDRGAPIAPVAPSQLEFSAELALIDAELERPATDPQEFDERMNRVRASLNAPALRADRTRYPKRWPAAVGIVLPTYNRVAFIGDAIASVQAQSFQNWELIVVDDGSSDNTRDVVADFAGDPRIRYFFQAHAGHAAARNRALRLAFHPLVAYIDSDNLWYPHFLDAAVAALDLYRDVDCVYGALVSEVHTGAPNAVLFRTFDRARLLDANFIDLNTIVHRRGLIEAHGGFDETMTRLVDWDLILRMTKDKPACRVPVLAAQYRVVDDRRVSDTYPLEPNREIIRRKWGVELQSLPALNTAALNGTPSDPAEPVPA